MLTEQNYDLINYMIKGGATDQEIIENFKITEGTLSRVKKSKGNYEEYKKIHGNEVLGNRREKTNKEDKANKEEKVIRHEQSVTIVASHYMAEEMKKQTELLGLISRKLAFIVDELTGVKTYNEKA